MKHTIFLLAGSLSLLIFPVEGTFSKSVAMVKLIEDAEQNTSLLDISAEPSSIIGGAVNVITGNYVESECDLLIPGSNPLAIQRSFNSGSRERGTLCHGWDLNLPSDITIIHDRTQGAEHPITAFVNDRGACVLFYGSRPNHMKLDRKQLKYGVTNCSSGILSSHTNIRNKKLIYHRSEAKHCELHEETGEKLFYKRISFANSKLEYVVNKNLFPNGCSFCYDYDRKDRISRVTSKGKQENAISHIQWEYPANFKTAPMLNLISLDGRKISYKYEKQQSHDHEGDRRYCLTSVLRDYAPEVSYEYRFVNDHSADRMIRKSLPDNRYLSVQYYEKGSNIVGSNVIPISSKKDARVGRVSSLYAPVGLDATPIMTWTIKYHLNKGHRSSKPIGGFAEVFDALGHKKCYHFSDEQRLTSVQHFLDSGGLYRDEKMIWEEHGDEKTFLMARGFTNSNGSLLLRRDYSYDKEGNVLQETFSGNLSGRGKGNVSWHACQNAEKYKKTYTYTSSGLVASEIDAGKKIEYQYLDQTNLISLKLVSDSTGIRERHQYGYDSNSTLIKEIIDDGTTRNINNLAGVTERRIRKIYPTKSKPIGLPEVTEEWFLNLSTGKEELLTRTENTYSKHGRLLLQKIYDGNNKYCYAKEWSYDVRGNVIQEVDPLGQVTTNQYDQNNNRIYQQTPNSEFHTLYFYDFADRLIREEKFLNAGDDKPFSVQSYSYDYMGNRVAVTDKYSNTTKFIYDEFGRVIETIHPPILNREGELEKSIEKVTYDCMNNPSSKIDANGYKTEFKYTAWGKPYEIISPEGTVEKSIYHLDGTLKKIIDPNGVETLYTHDYKGRKTKEEKISPEGECLAVRQWIYNSFHLIEEIDPAGNRKVYTYDGVGRLKRILKGDSETRYVYDSLGRQSEIWEMYDSGKFRRTLSEYDYLDRVVQETVMDEGGNIFTKKSYMYDVDGNRTHEIIHDNQFESCTHTVYNFEKKPVKIIQPDGSQTLFEYDDNFQNELGQTVALEKEIDPKGNQTIKVMDARGRVVHEERRDQSGTLLQSTTYCHDGSGNLISRCDDVLIEGLWKRRIKIEFLYDFNNREIAVIEAAGETLQKTTRKEYHPGGELSKIIKPDGLVLYHDYDYLWRLVDLYSSDGSIHYVHKYDQNSNLIEVEDLVHGIKTVRTIDENDRMISEKLGNGLVFLYRYDPRGRVQELVLPDMSTVEYSYDAANLCTIKRRSGRGCFSFDYHYNLSGRIAEMALPNDLGSIHYLYDSCLRTRNIVSKNWSQTIPKGGYDACGNLIKICQKDIVGELTSCYSYDPLYHLVAETGTAEHSYSFDSLHNRIKKNGAVHSNNELNQLTQQGEVRYEYDRNGNQTKKTDSEKKTTHQYDALDRLTTVITENQKTEYLYDSFHRRLKKSSFIMEANGWVETESSTFLYQGDKEIGAVDQRGQLTEMRTLGLGNNGEIGAAALLEINGHTLVPLHDFRGNVVTLVNVDDGKPIECYRYTAYGEEQIFDSLGNRQNDALSPWRFSSKRIDPETGWAFFGRRYYDSEIGKWTTPDPLRFKDSPNVYCFVRNRPMKYLDPDGRSISTTIGDNYEVCANCIRANCMKEYGGVEWGALETPNYFYYSAKYRVGTPRNDGLGMSYINGIGNSHQDSVSGATMYSNMAGGREVLGVYNASYGIGFDLVECALGLCGIETTPTKLIKENWDECFSNGNSRLLHLGHSQGMIHTRNTVPSYDEELRQRIELIAVAPGAHVKLTDFGRAVHYESKRDIVPFLEDAIFSTPRYYESEIKNRASVVRLQPHPDAPLFDHFNDSPTYQQPVSDDIKAFFHNYGG